MTVRVRVKPNKIGPAEVMRLRYEKLAAKAAKYTARIKAFGLPDPKVVQVAEGAIECIRKVAATLGKVPKNWKPARGTLTGAPIEVGAHVVLTDIAARRYRGIFPVGAVFQVLKIAGNKLLCLGGTHYRRGSRLPNARALTLLLLRSNVRKVKP